MDIAYSQTFTASGGTLPYSWTVIAGVLPTGLSLNAATGLLSGTPLTAGPYQFAVRVQDSANAVESTSVSLLVQPAPLVIATKSPLPAGVAGLDYPQQILAATGGIAPYTFSIPATSLPAGITLSNGVIGGTPTVAGTFSAPLTVTMQPVSPPPPLLPSSSGPPPTTSRSASPPFRYLSLPTQRPCRPPLASWYSPASPRCRSITPP